MRGREIGVGGRRAELVSRHHEEHQGGHLSEHLVDPRVLERYCDLGTKEPYLIWPKTQNSTCITRFKIQFIKTWKSNKQLRS